MTRLLSTGLSCGLWSWLSIAGVKAQAPTLVTETAVGVFKLHPVWGTEQAILETGGAVSPSASLSIDAGTTVCAAQSAWHGWTWQLSGSRNGELVGISAAFVQGSSGTVGLRVDIDADGTDDIVVLGPHNGSLQVPLLRPGGLTVRIRTLGRLQAATPAGEHYGLSLDLAWVASGSVPPALFLASNNFLSPCGPELWMEDSPALQLHRVAANTRGGFPAGPAVLALGFQTSLLPIPGSGCFLEPVPVAALWATADPTGRARWTLALPGPIRMADLYAQVVCLDSGQGRITSSNPIRVAFAD